MQKDNDKMNFEDKVNNAKYILDSTKEWINNVDIKISILIAFMEVYQTRIMKILKIIW